MFKRLFILHLIFLISSPVVFAQAKDVKIGVTLPLSGRLAFAGEDIRSGIELAVEEFASPELTFSVIYEDNQHSARLAVQTAQKLLSIDKVDLLISLWDMADPIAPLAEKAKTPHFAIRWNPHIAEEYEYTFTIESTYKSYTDKIIDLMKVMRVKKVAILTEEGQGWILASDYLKERAPQESIEISGEERYPSDTVDHRSTVLRLLARKPELIILFSNPPHTEILTKRIREANPNLRITGYFEYTESPALYEGIIFASQFESAAWFDRKFQKKYGKPFKARAPQAYDIIKLLSEAQSKSENKLKGKSLAEALAQSKVGSGASGKLSFSSRRVLENECVWKTFEQGRLRVVAESELNRAGFFDAR